MKKIRSIPKRPEDDLQAALTLAERARNKKGTDILVLDVQKISSLADFLLLTSVESQPQLRAIAEDLESFAQKKWEWKTSRDGQWESEWVVVDLGNIIVHVMTQAMRAYYRLEEIWSHGATTVYHE